MSAGLYRRSWQYARPSTIGSQGLRTRPLVVASAPARRFHERRPPPQFGAPIGVLLHCIHKAFNGPANLLGIVKAKVLLVLTDALVQSCDQFNVRCRQTMGNPA